MKGNALLMPLVAAGLLLGGCATKMQRKLQGQPVSVAVAALHNRPPDNAMDVMGGWRLFEWVTTDVILEQGNGYDRDPRWWTTDRTPLEGGFPGTHCVIKVYASWDEARGTWIVERYRNVWNEGCSMRQRPKPFRPISYLP